jgi:hypothetical protein
VPHHRSARRRLARRSNETMIDESVRLAHQEDGKVQRDTSQVQGTSGFDGGRLPSRQAPAPLGIGLAVVVQDQAAHAPQIGAIVQAAQRVLRELPGPAVSLSVVLVDAGSHDATPMACASASLNLHLPTHVASLPVYPVVEDAGAQARVRTMWRTAALVEGVRQLVQTPLIPLTHVAWVSIPPTLAGDPAVPEALGAALRAVVQQAGWAATGFLEEAWWPAASPARSPRTR